MRRNAVRTLMFVAGLAALLSTPSWAAEQCASLDAARWLIGTWIGAEGDKTFTETWTQLSATTFEGAGVTTKSPQRAVVDSESLRLVQMDGGVFYLAKVAHNRLPIAFELTQCSAQRLVFENAAHDFPRRIEYFVQSARRMQVHVSDGADKGFTLQFERQAERP